MRALAFVALACIAVVLATNLVVLTTTRADIRALDEFSPNAADAAVVLGATVMEDGAPSDMLEDRLDAAIALYESGAVSSIIVSGDNRPSHRFESEAMKRYCVNQGVPAEAILEDPAGYSTFESMFRMRTAFDVQHIIVATQEYHLPRALFAAEQLGMEAYGVISGQGTYENQAYYDFREALARTKDFFLALFAPSTD